MSSTVSYELDNSLCWWCSGIRGTPARGGGGCLGNGVPLRRVLYMSMDSGVMGYRGNDNYRE